MRAAHFGDRLLQRVGVGEEVGDAGVLLGQRQQEVLGGDVLIAEHRHLFLGPLEHPDQGGGGAHLCGLAQLRQVLDRLHRAGAYRIDVRGELLQDRDDQPVGLAQQRNQQVRRRDLGVASLGRQRLRCGHRFLGLDGESVGLHLLPFLGPALELRQAPLQRQDPLDPRKVQSFGGQLLDAVQPLDVALGVEPRVLR